MRIIRKHRLLGCLVLALLCGTIISPIDVLAVSSTSFMEEFSQNNITFYDPDECISQGGSGVGVGKLFAGNCGGEITASGNKARLEEMVEKYGSLAMNLQITYGTPWEFLLAQMVAESGVGTAGIAARQAKDGKYNWIGLTCGSKNRSTARYANGITKYRRPANEGGGCYESYDSIELMMKSYASGDFFRNGRYDYALKYTDKDNYSMEMFARAAFSCYVPGRCNELLPSNHFYVKTTLSYIKNTIRPLAQELGYPTSEELQKQQNIPVGGKYPLGTPKAQAYDDSVTCSSVGGNGDSTQRLGDVSVGLDTVTDDESSFGIYPNPGSTTSLDSATSQPVSGMDITWIGDSYSVGARTIIEEKFPGISFGGSVENSNSYIQSNKFVDTDNVGGVSNPSALNVLKHVIAMNELKPYLVMAVGTNGGWTDEMIDKFKTIMSSHSETKVVFVTAKAKAHLASDDNGTNQRLKEFTDSNPNYTLADWAAVYDEKYFDNNSTHPTANGGYEKWVEVIRDALLGSGASGCNMYEGELPQYLQCDAKWKNTPYGITKTGAPGTICEDGCGPASLAMLVTAATGQDVLPKDLAEITQGPGNCSYFNDSSPACGGGFARVEYTKKVCEKYGCEVKQLPDNNVDTIRQALKEGWMIHLSGGAASDSPEASLATHDTATNPFMTTGHFVGIFKIDSDDNVMVADSAGNGRSEYPGRFNRQMTLAQATANRWYNKPIMAIRGKGGNSGKNTCEVVGNYCAAEGGGSGGDNVGGDITAEGGLTTEQAKKLATYYNSPSTPLGHDYSHGKKNCVAFSGWFVSFLTDLSNGKKVTRGNGIEIAKNLAKDFNLPLGNEPRPFAIFSTRSCLNASGGKDGHTGLITAVNENGTVDFIDAWWQRPPKPGKDASVFTKTPCSNVTYVYLDGHVDVNKLNSIVGG